MKRVVTVRDVEEAMRSGINPAALVEGAIVTPAAMDLLREAECARPKMQATASVPAPPADKAPGPPWKPFNGDPAKFFDDPANRARCEAICDIGRRLWTREYVDGNGGNLSIRLAENLALCTPTGVSKGFMRPDQMCLVDLDGNQLAGTRRRTSEILMHLETFRAQPAAVACVHAHPPTATAFAAAGIAPPNNILSEYELFVGEVGMAPYETPGTVALAREVGALAKEHTTILMANHGAVAWSPLSLEDAYFRIEILEAYCRTLMATTLLGRAPVRFTPEQIHDLMGVKQRLGVPDTRIGRNVEQLRREQDDEWHPAVACAEVPVEAERGCKCKGHAHGAGGTQTDPDAERLVREIVDIIMANAAAGGAK